VRERRTRVLESGDVATAAVFGLPGAVLVLAGRTDVRLRCTACRCRFPEPAGALRIAIRVALLACILCAVAYWCFVEAAGHVVAILAAAGVALLHVALCIGLLRRVRTRWRMWRERAAELAVLGSRA
jgi:hypothetical protein